MRISNRDWESISAYLDGQLSVKERSRLEVKLQASADLRAALEDMRRTRLLLRSQPRLRAPHNFMLTPQMVGAASARRLSPRPSPVFGMVSALASFLLVVVLAGEFLTSSPRMAAQPAPAVVLQEAQPAETTVVDQAARQGVPEAPAMEAPLLAQESSEASSKTATGPVEAPAPLEYISPTQTAQVEALMAPPPAEPAVGAAGALPTEQVQTEMAQSEAEMTAEEPALQQSPPGWGGETAADSAITPPTAPAFWNNWRTAQALLLLVAFASGLSALALRRSGH